MSIKEDTNAPLPAGINLPNGSSVEQLHSFRLTFLLRRIILSGGPF